MKSTLLILLILGAFSGPVTLKEGEYTLNNEISSMYLEGTSTMHDWMVNVLSMKGRLSASTDDQHIISIKGANVEVAVLSMKSGKVNMDKNIYSALKEKDYPNISFQLKDYSIHNSKMTVKGELTIAGVTKLIETEVVHRIVDNKIEIDGKLGFKMTEFGIEPPEFLFGAFKTGDEIKLKFYFMFDQV
jgi:polyisoprenoid-binding protein YceI